MNTPRTILSFILATLLMAQCQFGGDKTKELTETSDQSPLPTSIKNMPELVRDDRGNIIERHRYSYSRTDSSMLSYESYYYKFDLRGNVVHEVKESYTPEGDLKYRNVNQYKYNDQDLKTEVIFKSFNGSEDLMRTAHHGFKYNEKGYKIEDTGYNQDGLITTRIIMEPDSNGLLITEEFIQYDNLGTITEHKKFYYSDHGLQKSVDLLKDE